VIHLFCYILRCVNAHGGMKRMLKHLQFSIYLLVFLVLGNILCADLAFAAANSLQSFPADPSPDYMKTQGNKVVRWNDDTRIILVYIELPHGMPNWRPEDVTLVKAAFSEWQRAMNNRIRFLYMPDQRAVDVSVYWQTRAVDNNHGEEIQGENRTILWGNYIQMNDIVLALNDKYGNPLSPAAIQSVALHEIGHMLGIRGHSNDSNDIMAPSMDSFGLTEPKHLTSRDINTLSAIYRMKPNYTNPEGIHLSSFEDFKKHHSMRSVWIPIPFFL